jgi:hypothetical protein
MNGVCHKRSFDPEIKHGVARHIDGRSANLHASRTGDCPDDAVHPLISTFSGTHYVTPRTVTGTIGFTFE